ncbi:MAG: hypothetical protein JKY65_02420 [Planctomycetes bacterium]|nr:hypothetical protein [Planctomycetota bacterium]
MSDQGQDSQNAQEPRDASFVGIAAQVVAIAFLLVLVLWCGRQGSYFLYQGF